MNVKRLCPGPITLNSYFNVPRHNPCLGWVRHNASYYLSEIELSWFLGAHCILYCEMSCLIGVAEELAHNLISRVQNIQQSTNNHEIASTTINHFHRICRRRGCGMYRCSRVPCSSSRSWNRWWILLGWGCRCVSLQGLLVSNVCSVQIICSPYMMCASWFCDAYVSSPSVCN